MLATNSQEVYAIFYEVKVGNTLSPTNERLSLFAGSCGPSSHSAPPRIFPCCKFRTARFMQMLMNADLPGRGCRCQEAVNEGPSPC